MKLFPFILIRLAGLPFPKLSNPLEKEVHLFQEAQLIFEKSKEELANALVDKKDSLSNYFEKQVIVNLLKDLNQDRTIKFKSRFSFLQTISPQLAAFKQSKKDVTHAHVKLTEAFTTAQLNFHEQLKQHFFQENFKSSLPLSSISAASNIDKFLNAKKGRVNKKLRQSAASALNFYTRASTKTSPFAGLGPVAWLGAKNEGRQVFKLNQVLLIYWEEYFLTQNELRDFLPFQLNSTIVKTEDTLSYLVNDRNVEAIKKLPNQDLLDHILINNATDKKSISAWVNLLEEIVDADRAALQDFIHQLIQEGIFLPLMPCNREAEDWVEKWLTFFDQNSSSVFDAAANLFKMTKAYIDSDGKEESEKKEVHDRWKEILGEDFDLSMERFVYRDDYKKSEKMDRVVVPENFTVLFEIISEVLPFLHQLHFSSPWEAVQKIFALKNKASIPLLTFYEDYHGFNNSSKQSGINLEAAIHVFKSNSTELKNNAKKVLQDQLTSDIIHLDLSAFKKIFGDQQKPRNHFWLGALFQLGKDLPYLRHTFPGHAKMMARFILDEQVRKAVFDIHKSRKDVLYVDHSDNSAFNANLHPILTPANIASIYPTADSSENNPIALQDLYVKKMDGQLVLWSKSKQKQCIPINYGLEGLDRRSPLYQLIQQFGPQVPDIELLARFIKSVVAQEKPWGKFIPRIIVANKIVIQRRQWILNIKIIKSLIDETAIFFPNKSASPSKTLPVNLFYPIISFFKTAGIPTTAYFRLVEKAETSVKTNIDFRKPQFLNINEPDYFIRLSQMLKSDAAAIIVEEIYPIPNDQGMHAGYCQEWLVDCFDEL